MESPLRCCFVAFLGVGCAFRCGVAPNSRYAPRNMAMRLDGGSPSNSSSGGGGASVESAPSPPVVGSSEGKKNAFVRVWNAATAGTVTTQLSIVEIWRRRRQRHLRDSREGMLWQRRAGGGDYQDERKYGYEPAFKELELKRGEGGDDISDKNIMGRLFRAERTPFLVLQKAFLGFIIAYLVFPSLAQLLWRSLPPLSAAATVAASGSTATSLWQIRGAVASAFAPAVGTLYGTMQVGNSPVRSFVRACARACVRACDRYRNSFPPTPCVTLDVRAARSPILGRHLRFRS